MSNPAVITLAEIKHGIAGLGRLQIEDNIGEAIHCHLGPVRLDLTVNDLWALADGMRAALDATGRFAPYTTEQFDPLFLQACGPLLTHLTGIDIEEHFIDDLRCIVYRSRRFGLYKLEPVTQTPAYRFLTTQEDHFLTYKQSGYFGMTNTERLLSLASNIEHFGYPNEGKHIILFQGQNIIRDGQHRAAILRYLQGNVKIPVMVFRFSKRVKLSPIQWRTFYFFAKDALIQLRKRYRNRFRK